MAFNSDFIKRRYFELRAGNTVVSPVISASTFVGVSFLYLQDIMPIYVFVPLFVGVMAIALTIIGLKFRKIQYRIDLDIQYEQQTELNQTFYVILKAQESIMRQMGIDIPKGFTARLSRVKKIAEGSQ